MFNIAENNISASNGLMFTVPQKPDTHTICVRINQWPVWIKTFVNDGHTQTIKEEIFLS